MPADSNDFRMDVMLGALNLFEAKGYEATTVDEIAEAAGISRRTFFRQFRAKEDVVFVDHDILLAQVTEYLAAPHPDAHAAVVEGAARVYDRFGASIDTTRRRYLIVKDVPTLRDREIVMTFRYEGLFVEFLRRTVTGGDDLATVQFAAAVTATHNFLLRRLVRDGVLTASSDVRAELGHVRDLFDRRAGTDDVVVAVFPRGTSPQSVADALGRHLGASEL